MTDTYYVDVSSWQSAVNDAYPHPMFAFRVDYGGGLDGTAPANWKWAQRTPRVRVVIGYIVFKAGQGPATLARLKGFFGPTAPAKVVVMIDMESGAEFAGPGDHSAEANALAQGLADWLGDRRRVIGYANNYDWTTCWPSAPAWLKRVTAAYGTQDPGTWGWQYAGGDARWNSPAGYPRSCPPFGSNVDMNVIHRSIDQIAADCGLSTEEFVMDSEVSARFSALEQKNTSLETKLDQLLSLFNGSDDQPHTIEFTVAHVVHGHKYRSLKGEQWPVVTHQPAPKSAQ